MSLQLGKKDWKLFVESKKILTEDNYIIRSFKLLTDMLGQKEEFSDNELRDSLDWLTDINEKLLDINQKLNHDETFSTIELTKWTFIIKKLKNAISKVKDKNLRDELLFKLNYLIRQHGNGADSRHKELTKKINA